MCTLCVQCVHTLKEINPQLYSGKKADIKTVDRAIMERGGFMSYQALGGAGLGLRETLRLYLPSVSLRIESQQQSRPHMLPSSKF